MPLVDYHVHPNTFLHGKYNPVIEPLKPYLESARKAGITELGFAEHGPRPHPTYNHTALKPDELELYLQTLRKLQEENPDVQIKAGIEIDFETGSGDYWRTLLDGHSFDFVACSIHYLPNWLPTHEGMKAYIEDGKTIKELYSDFYAILQEAAQTRIFSFLAHPDLIKIHSILNHIPEPKILPELWEETCKVLAENGQCIEFDTGWKKGNLNCFRPEPWMAKVAAQHGVAFTLGSDAHHAKDIGSDYPEAIRILKGSGVDQIAGFTQMKRVMLPLD
jgi:histidinol-phosphatase (PHP family)